MTREDIRFYCGINEHRWNKDATMPGAYACVAPVYGRTLRTREINGVTLPQGTRVLQDSGAFSDSTVHRLDAGLALERMYQHSMRYGYESQVSHRASYDFLIDEMWDSDGVRSKHRWTEDDAQFAVDETIRAAVFLSGVLDRRGGVGAILSAQGVTPGQYLFCVEHILPYLSSGDILGLGGWCITGKMPRVMLPLFKATMRLVIPYVAAAGVSWVHVWGMCYAPALGYLLALCDRYEIAMVSVDSASPQLRPIFGKWGYAEWTDRLYRRGSVDELGQDRRRHVECMRVWLSTFRDTIWYQQAWEELDPCYCLR